jgi:hypothetical protein
MARSQGRRSLSHKAKTNILGTASKFCAKLDAGPGFRRDVRFNDAAGIAMTEGGGPPGLGSGFRCR